MAGNNNAPPYNLSQEQLNELRNFFRQEPAPSINVASLAPEAHNAQERKDEPVPTPNQREDAVGRAELDAKLDAAEARNETKIAGLQGEMRAGFADLRAESRILLGKIDTIGREIETARSEQKASRLWIIGTILVVATASVAAVLADRANILAAMQTAIALTQAQQRPAANSPPTPERLDERAPRP